MLCPVVACGQSKNPLLVHPGGSLPPQTGATVTSQGRTPASTGTRLPQGFLSNLTSNASFNPSPFHNKPTVLCFFASWCSTCRRELPRLLALQHALSDSFAVCLVTYESATHSLKQHGRRAPFWPPSPHRWSPPTRHSGSSSLTSLCLTLCGSAHPEWFRPLQAAKN
jgi:hypothetical protein